MSRKTIAFVAALTGLVGGSIYFVRADRWTDMTAKPSREPVRKSEISASWMLAESALLGLALTAAAVILGAWLWRLRERGPN